MKTILGHVQSDENLLIRPVSIYCMCFSENSEFIYTGDENGTIKIWSTLTGGIIETFKLIKTKEDVKATINDLIDFNNCLIACSEDSQVVIWDTRNMKIYERFCLDEVLSYLNGYKYKSEKNEKYLLIIGAKSGKMYVIDMDIQNSKDENYKKIFPIKFYVDKTIQEKYCLGKIMKSLELRGMCSDDTNGLLISGFQDGLVCIWDTTRILDVSIKNRKTLDNLSHFVFYAQLCHKTTVHLIEFSPDKTHFLTGSLDGTVLVWRILPDVVASIRKEYFINPETNLTHRVPVNTLKTINESEDRIKCSVNVATWTKGNHYIIAMISSRQRKKHNQGINVFNFSEVEIIEDDPNANSSKRTSSLIIYSLKLNKIIHKYNEKSGIKGLDFIDDNFIFGCHPLYEEIIFTLNGTRNIILFDIKKGEVIKKFKQNDFFFEFDKKTPLALEGSFSQKGDYFAIATCSGSLSIFSIYSKNSYSATYMNQFYSKEFEANLEQINNNFSKNGVPSLSSIFPTHVNMHNLPYPCEQPYSSYKLNQISSYKKIITDRYCISNKELLHRFLANNLLTYERNFQERVLECQKEEEAFYNAEKDNMNYRINRENNNNNVIESDFLREENNINRDNNLIYAEYDNRYNYLNDSDRDIESNMDLSSDDLRVISTLRNENYNNTNQRGHYTRTSTRYNLRNNIINNTHSPSNSINRNNDNNNYNLRTRIEVTSVDGDEIIINNNENDINLSNRRKNIIQDDEEEEIPKKKEKKKEKENKDIIIKQRPGSVFVVHRRIRKEDKEKEKEKENMIKEKRHYRRHGHDDEDEDYIYTNSPRRKRGKYKKRGRKKKKQMIEEEEEDDGSDSDYHEPDSEENKDTSKIIEEEKEEIKDSSDQEKNDDIDIEEEEETNTIISTTKHKKTKKLIKKSKIDSDEDSIINNDEKNKDKNKDKDKSEEIIIEKEENISENKNKKHKLLTSEIFDDHNSNISSIYSKKLEKLPKDKITNDHLQHKCYFCHQVYLGDKNSSSKLFGPFYYNKTTGKILPNKSDNNSEEKEIYIDIDCFPENNNDNYIESLEQVLKEAKICFRCGSPFATKRCFSCQKMFHGNLCFKQMSEEYKDNRYCLECYKKEYYNHVQEKIRTLKVSRENIDRKSFLGKKIFYSQYYPQKGEEVYFILHAYIQFLKDKYEYIIYEIEDEKQRIFWWNNNPNIGKNPRFNFYEPFLCRVINIEYIFPNNQTMVLIKEKSDSDEHFYKNLKILMKLTLEIIDLKNSEITIILFENDCPDFLVRKQVYEETSKYYEENILTKKETNFKMNLSEDVVKVILSEDKSEEDNEYFSKSKFNSLNVISIPEKEEQKYSFWDIHINKKMNIISEKMKYIMAGLKLTINSIYKKNEKEMEIFWERDSKEISPDYYNDIQVPMFLKLIVDRLENDYYITEESIKFDIQLLVNNVKTNNTEHSAMFRDVEILKDRLFKRIEQLSINYKENKNVISSGTSIKINLNSDSGSGNESNKKMIGKKRKRIIDDLDYEENFGKDYDDSEDYIFINNEKSKNNHNHNHINIKEGTSEIVVPISDTNTESNISNGNNNFNNTSINIQMNNGNTGSIVKKKKKKKMF